MVLCCVVLSCHVMSCLVKSYLALSCLCCVVLCCDVLCCLKSLESLGMNIAWAIYQLHEPCEPNGGMVIDSLGRANDVRYVQISLKFVGNLLALATGQKQQLQWPISRHRDLLGVRWVGERRVIAGRKSSAGRPAFFGVCMCVVANDSIFSVLPLSNYEQNVG
jgi:hypothetical protein